MAAEVLFDDLHTALADDEYTRAAGISAEILGLCTRCPHAKLDHTEALFLQGDYVSCAQTVDELLASGFPGGRLRVIKGNLVSETESREAAVDWYRAATDIEPNLHEANCNLASALVQLDRTGEALEPARAAFETAPDEDKASSIYCWVLAECELRDELTALEPALDAVEWETSNLIVNVALAFSNVENEAAALRWAQKALVLDENPRALCLISRTYFYTLKRPEDALPYFQRLKTRDSERHGPWASLHIAKVLGESQENWREALTVLIESRVVFPEDADIKTYLDLALEKVTGDVRANEAEVDSLRKRFEALSQDHDNLRHAILELTSAAEPGKPLHMALVEGEGQSIEFMASFPANARDLAKEIAAFSTSNDGDIYLGVEDDGTVAGLAGLETVKERDEFHRRVSGITRGVIQPAVAVQISLIPSNQRVIARIHVPKGSKPVYYVGHVPYVRHLDQSRPAEPEEVEALVLNSM